MRVLIVHNHYGHFAVGGESQVAYDEADLLRERGHQVLLYERSNSELLPNTPAGALRVLVRCASAWCEKARTEIGDVIRRFKPDVMHVHNYWYLLTPSIFAAAKDYGISTVRTLHSYGLICPGGQFLRGGKACESCLTGNPWRCVWYRCYTDSASKSIPSLLWYLRIKKRDFLSSVVDAYILLSKFARTKHIQAGLPAHKLFVKHNFMRDPFEKMAVPATEGAVFVGRLSPEKGVGLLIEAWRGLDYPLTIIGHGPLYDKLKAKAGGPISFVGALKREDVLRTLASFRIFIFPSLLYEGFPLTLLEAMALGKAIIASDLGPRREMITDGLNGLLFSPGSREDLRRKLELLISNPLLARNLGEAARSKYLTCYTPDANYDALMEIYNTVIHNRRQDAHNEWR